MALEKSFIEVSPGHLSQLLVHSGQLKFINTVNISDCAVFCYFSLPDTEQKTSVPHVSQMGGQFHGIRAQAAGDIPWCF